MKKTKVQKPRMFHAPDAMWAAIERAADAKGVTMSEWIRLVILKALKAQAFL